MTTVVAENQLQRDTERILQATQPAPASRVALVVLAGLPASGKTHIATELSRRTGAVVLESDACRSLLFAERRYTRAENRRLFAAIHASIGALLAQRSQVILDATTLTERDRAPLYELAEQHDAALIMVLVTAPSEVAQARLEQRALNERSHSEADVRVYEEMQWRIEEIRRPHLVIDTSIDIEPALDALTKEMMQQ